MRKNEQAAKRNKVKVKVELWGKYAVLSAEAAFSQPEHKPEKAPRKGEKVPKGKKGNWRWKDACSPTETVDTKAAQTQRAWGPGMPS